MQPNSAIWRILEFYGTRINHRGKWRVHAFLRRILRANCNCDIEVERQGLRWRLNPSDFVQTHLFWTGEYEYMDVHHPARCLRPDAVVFDVGANFGYYSIMLASAMRGTGQVFAFEPNQAAYARLQTNIALNKLDSTITAIRCGLSDSPRSAFLRETDGNSGATVVSDEPTTDPIVLDTLDRFCARRNIDHIDIIKIDVEGNERHVLEGGRAVLSENKPVLMIEFNPYALERAGSSARELAKLLAAWGYQLFIARRDRLVPLQSIPDGGVIINVFCVPASQARDIKEVA